MLVWSHRRSITPFDEQKWGLQAMGRVEEVTGCGLSWLQMPAPALLSINLLKFQPPVWKIGITSGPTLSWA